MRLRKNQNALRPSEHPPVRLFTKYSAKIFRTKSTPISAVRHCYICSRTDWGEGGDTTISSPGRSPKQPLPGMRLHDPLHGRQACPKFIAFDQGLGQICPGRGYFRAVPSQNGDKYAISPPSQSLTLYGADDTPKKITGFRCAIRIFG